MQTAVTPAFPVRPRPHLPRRLRGAGRGFRVQSDLSAGRVRGAADLEPAGDARRLSGGSGWSCSLSRLLVREPRPRRRQGCGGRARSAAEQAAPRADNEDEAAMVAVAA